MSLDAPKVKFSTFDIQVNTLNKEFMNDLRSVEHDTTTIKLVEIFENHKSDIRFSCYRSSEIEGVYLVLVKGKNDSILISLARKYGFPRGFPIIWKPKKYLHFYGFYPKFENDKREEKKELCDSKDFMDIQYLDCNFKYSGFLAQIIVFEHDDTIYWCVCSKNSVNNEYSNWARDIFSKKITIELLKFMLENSIHICGECLSKNDQTHGAKVSSEDLVVTCVGIGHEIFLSDGVIQKGHIGTETNSFVQFMDHRQMLEFAVRFNLSIDSIFSVRGENIDLFINELFVNRDQITLDRFLDVSKYSEEIHGTVRHENILGNTLEGLIIKIVYASDKQKPNKIIKFKFPYYTIRTMFLREYLENNNNTRRLTFFKSLDRWVNSWVITENGRYYWKYVGCMIFRYFHELRKMYVTESIQEAFHIFACDTILSIAFNMYNPYANYAKLFDEAYLEEIEKIRSDPNGAKLNIVLCLGAIGSGKSTIANILCRQSDKFEHVDGDILGLNEEIVVRLKEERKPYTFWKIIEILTKNKIPVLTAGGGVLFNKHNQFDLVDALVGIFGESTKINITVLISHLEDKATILTPEQIDELIRLDNLKEISKSESYVSKVGMAYSNRQLLSQAITNRQQRKIKTWMNAQVHQVYSASMRNYSFVIEILKSSKDSGNLSNVILYPYVMSENRDKMSDIFDDFDDIFSKLETSNVRIENMRFEQKRLLVSYDLGGELKTHHVTLDFDPTKNVQIKENKYDDQYECEYYAINSVDNLDEFLRYTEQILVELNGRSNAIKIYDESMELFSQMKDKSYFEIVSDVRRLTKLESNIKILVGIYQIEEKCRQLEISTIEFLKVPIDDHTHVTINSGCHEPKFMRDVSNAISENMAFVDLPTRDHKLKRYILKNDEMIISPKKVWVMVHDLFYL